jgi:hypothetical protein
VKIGESVVSPVDKPGKSQDSYFARVIRYFLDHEKPKAEPSRKAKKPSSKPRKKPSTKIKKSA